MQKSDNIALADEAMLYYHQERQKKTSVKSAELANAIIKAICEVDDLTPFIIKNALKMTEEIVETMIINTVIS